MPGDRIRLLCVDDHRIVREGIAAIVNRQQDFVVVASASSGEEAVDLFERERPDVVLLDLQLPCMSGVEVIHRIRRISSSARIVVLTMYDGDQDIHDALTAGAAAYLLKDTISEDLFGVIRQVYAGQRAIPPDIQARLADRETLQSLTSRELQVVELMAQALRNKEIAASLDISEQTVHAHVKNIFAKLGVQDRVAAVNTARRRGMIH